MCAFWVYRQAATFVCGRVVCRHGRNQRMPVEGTHANKWRGTAEEVPGRATGAASLAVARQRDKDK